MLGAICRFGPVAVKDGHHEEAVRAESPGRKASPSVLFAVGRLDKRGTRIVFLQPPRPTPIPGPWELRAVCRA